MGSAHPPKITKLYSYICAWHGKLNLMAIIGTKYLHVYDSYYCMHGDYAATGKDLPPKHLVNVGATVLCQEYIS